MSVTRNAPLEAPKFKIRFQIFGKKTQGIGYRAHIASIAITSGVKFLHVENLPKTRRDKLERVDVYAGASRQRNALKTFYGRVRSNIPEEAKDVKFTAMKIYHSAITIPTVKDFVALLTAGQLSKGIKYIEDSGNQSKIGFQNLQKGISNLNTDINKGFGNVVSAIGKINSRR